MITYGDIAFRDLGGIECRLPAKAVLVLGEYRMQVSTSKLNIDEPVHSL